MGRRTFENKSRAQNTREIVSQRTEFSGQYSDLPANELAPQACREIINGCAFTETLEPREGMEQVIGFAVPGKSAAFDATKSSTTVSLDGHTASSANVGSWIVYDTGEVPDLITGVSGSNYTVADTGTITAGATGTIRPRVYGWYYHKHLGVYVVHLGTSLYVVNATTYVWTLINQTGDNRIPASRSKIVELGDRALVFCQGVWKVDINSLRYWQTNVDPADNTLVNIIPPYGYLRRYLYTMTRQSGTARLFNDRQSLTIEQETGSNKLNSSNIDYKEIFTGAQQVGPSTITYYMLTTGAVTSTAGIAGVNCFFDLTVDGTLYTISFAPSATATLSGIATAIQTACRAQIAETFTVTYNPGTKFFYIRNIAPSSVVSYLASPTANPDYTDVSALLKGTVATGATLTTVAYYAQASLQYYTPNVDWKSFTHYSFYETRQLTRSGASTVGNPSAYAWMTDYPLMKAIKGSWSGTTLTATTGQFGHFDSGNYVTIVNGSDSTYQAYQKYFASAPSSTGSATVDSSVVGGIANAHMFVGAQEGCILDATNGDCTAVTWIQTWNSVTATYSPILADNTVAVGDPLFLSNGDVAWITSVTDNKHFTIDATSYSCSKQPACAVPKLVGSGFQQNIIKDDVDDAVVSSRIGTLGLRSRFYTAMPAVTTGVVSPGFVCCAYQNRFLWNNISVDQQYIIGNNHPAYQVQELNGSVAAMAVNGNYVSLFAVNSTYSVQTNLNLSYTDLANGNVIYTLPTPVLTDMYIGVLQDQHLFEYERDMVAAINQDGGLRTWNGTAWSSNLVFKKIQKKIKALVDKVLTYDVTYGMVIMGTDSKTAYNRIYTLGIREDKYLGASEFTLLPFADPGIQPLNVGTRMVYLSLGVTASRWADGLFSTWLDGSTLDVPNSLITASGNEIPWSFTTGDDKGSSQGNTLRHLESKLFVSGRGQDETVARATTINVLAYNDIGAYVTQNRSVKSSLHYYGDINMDARIEGHRIRFKYEFDKACLVVNGATSYYSSYDKASSLTSRATTESDWQTQIAAPTMWNSRCATLFNLATGKVVASVGTITRTTGPDGRSGTALST